MQKKQFLLIFFVVSLLTARSIYSQEMSLAQDPSTDTIIKEETAPNEIIIVKINLSGVKYSSKRVNKQLPIKVGDVWNDAKKLALIKFLKQLEQENIIEDKNYLIKDEIADGKATINISLAEKLPLFAFAFPFYSTTKGFKAKIKFWNFYTKGYLLPLEAQLEYVAREKIGLEFKADKVKIGENLDVTFNLNTYTSTLNYLSTDYNWHADDWESGVEDLYLRMNISVPKFGTEIQPYLGFGYGNLLKTKNEYDISQITKQDHTTIASAKLKVKQPLDKKGSFFLTNVGFGYKNFASLDTSDDTAFADNEFSLSLIGNNPTSIDEPLDYPVRLAQFGIALDKINEETFFYTGLDMAVAQTPSASSSYNDMKLKDFSYSEFDDDILKKINNTADRAFVESCYYKDTNDSKYKIKKNASSESKQKIWDILIKNGIIASNGFLLKPNFSFDFAVGKTGLHIKPGAYFQWDLKYENTSRMTHELIGGLTFGMNYKIPFVDMDLKFYSDVRYNHKWVEHSSSDDEDDNATKDQIIIKDITFSAEKHFDLSNFYLDRRLATEDLRKEAGHNLKFEFHAEGDPVCEIENYKMSQNIYEMNLKMMYQLYLPTYMSHRFKFRSLIFASFNNVIEKAFGRDFEGGWMRGKGFDNLKSYAGLILNFDYWIPLFTVDTNKIVTKQMKKPMVWEVYWILYTDVMLAATNQETSITLDHNLLHLMPALTIGTAFRVYPKFIPLNINIEASLNTYNLVKEKGSFTSYLFFEFSIAHQISTNWFYK